MSAQDVTLQQYHQWMKVNATAHLIRSARQVGIFAELREGQRTLEQICAARTLATRPTELLLDALVAVGIIEKYADDFALSRAAHLLCQYDDDLGDERWSRLAAAAQGRSPRTDIDDQRRFDRDAATQWVHTPAAIQAAEILDVGGPDQPTGIAILDLGCGSAVWSCAMAHRDATATITAVDHAGALAAARATAQSINLDDRMHAIESLPAVAELPAGAFDIALLAQRTSGLDDQATQALLERAVTATRPGGRVVVIDLFRGPAKPNLVEAIEALTLELETAGGRLRTVGEAQRLLDKAGLTQIQFTFLPASHANLGMAVGVR